MATQQSFAELFGGATENVDYSNRAAANRRNLPIPAPEDDLQVIARKIRHIADVVEQGGSAAVATGFKGAAQSVRDPEELAKLSMTPKELEQFEVWRKGVRLPEFDWDDNMEAPPKGKGSDKRYAYRAAALDTMYNHIGALPEHAAWLTKNWTYAIPLMVAIAKVHAAKRELVGGSSTLTEMELAEIQVTHRIVAIATGKVNEVYAAMNQIARDINQSKEKLQAREHSLKGKIEGYKKRKDPINDERGFEGQAPIDSNVDYSRGTAGARTARTNLLAGTAVAPSRRAEKRRRDEPVVQARVSPAPGQFQMAETYEGEPEGGY